MNKNLVFYSSLLPFLRISKDKVVLTMNIGRNILKYKAEITAEICRLIGIRSVNDVPEEGKPYGAGVAQALDYMLALGERLGFRSCRVDGYAGHIEFGDGEEIVAVLVHLDTVAAGEGWTSDPFKAVVKEGLIIGRGASDNKGPAVVAVYALCALRDAISQPGRRVRVIFGTDEECGMRDMDVYFAKQPLPKYSFTPDASYPIIHAEKGYLVVSVRGSERLHRARAIKKVVGGDAPNMVPDQCYAILDREGMSPEQWEGLNEQLYHRTDADASLKKEGTQWRLVVRGRSGHGSYPPSGENAIAKLLVLLEAAGLISEDDKLLTMLHHQVGFEAFGQSLGIACQDVKHGKLTVNLAAVRVDEQEEKAVFNIRYPVTEDENALLLKLYALFAEKGMQLSVDQHMPPLHVPEEHPLLAKLGRAYETVMGEPARLLSIGGGTYARKLQGTGVAFGAGFPGRQHGPGPHQADECVSIEDLMLHGQICTQALYELQIRGDEEDA